MVHVDWTFLSVRAPHLKRVVVVERWKENLNLNFDSHANSCLVVEHSASEVYFPEALHCLKVVELSTWKCGADDTQVFCHFHQKCYLCIARDNGHPGWGCGLI